MTHWYIKNMCRRSKIYAELPRYKGSDQNMSICWPRQTCGLRLAAARFLLWSKDPESQTKWNSLNFFMFYFLLIISLFWFRLHSHPVLIAMKSSKHSIFIKKMCPSVVCKILIQGKRGGRSWVFCEVILIR